MAEEKKKQNMEGKEMSFEERQYQRLIDARNFHYENFNKWSLYFYAIIAALFIGLYSIKDNMILSCVIALVGYVVSICCYLSGKGYYYWEISWIRLVQAYERRLIVEEKKSYYVYSLFVEKDKSSHPTSLLEGSNISSSKLSLLMSFVISSAWGYLLFKIPAHVIWGHLRSAIGITKPLCFCCKTFWELLVGIAAIGITCCVVICMAKCTKLHSDMNKLDEAFENPELKVYLTK